MEMGVECSDRSSFSDHWFPFMEEDQMRSKGWFRKFLQGLVQQRCQKHIPEVSEVSGVTGVTDDSFRSSREIVPEQCDEPLGLDVVLPLISDQFLKNHWMRSSLLKDPVEFLIQKRP